MVSRPLELGTQHMERVTGIEPALSAWESDRLGPLTALTWGFDAPPVTVMDPVTPGLMARQWPVPRWLWRRRPSWQAIVRAWLHHVDRIRADVPRGLALIKNFGARAWTATGPRL
jgi:hypothetical protein